MLSNGSMNFQKEGVKITNTDAEPVPVSIEEAEINLDIDIRDLDATKDNVAVKNSVSGNELAINPDGSINTTTNIDTTGLATETKQDTGNASLSSIDTKLNDVSTTAKQDLIIGELQDIETEIEGTNTRLDTLNAKDFATSAKQDTGNTTLSSIDTKVSTSANQDLTNTKLDTLNATDFATSAKQDTQITNQTTLNTRVGDLTETAPATDTAASGLNGRLQRIAQRLSTLISDFTNGLYQFAIRGNTDGTKIGNVGDSLKTVTVLNKDNNEVTGTITGASQTVQASTNGDSAALIVVTGTFVATLQIAVSKDGSTWFLNPSHISAVNPNTTQITGPNAVRTVVAGWNFVRLFSTSYTSGTANVNISTFQHDVMVSAWQHGAWGMRVQDSAGNGISSVSGALKVTVSQSGIAEEGKLFSISRVINASDSDEDNPLLYLVNPTGTTKKFFIWRARIGSVVTNTSMLCKFYLNPTVTDNGTSATPINRNVNGLTNPSTVSQVYTIPTVSSLGTLLTTAVVGQNTVSIDLNENFSIVLNPNSSLLITGQPSSNNRAAGISLVWQEENV